MKNLVRWEAVEKFPEFIRTKSLIVAVGSRHNLSTYSNAKTISALFPHRRLHHSNENPLAVVM
jgi:hypothetical protein